MPSQKTVDTRPARGQSVAELAIVLPVVMLLFLAVLQLGMILMTQVGLINAAREVARNAANIPVATTADATAAAATYYGRLTNSTSGFLRRNVAGYDASHLVTTPANPHTRVCYYSFTDASGAPAVMARVDVEYSHPLFVPLLSALFDGFDGSSDNGWRLNAIEDIRVGNLPLTSTNIGDINSQTCSP